MQNNYILNQLKSSNATLAVLVLALCAQIPHAADVFRLIPYVLVQTSGDDAKAQSCEWLQCAATYVHSYLFAIALEMAVLLFVVRNKQRESWGFAAVSVAMNLAYYYLHGVGFFALPALLVSVALPVAIALYSHAVADAEPHKPEVEPELQEAQPEMQEVAEDDPLQEVTEPFELEELQPAQAPEELQEIEAEPIAPLVDTQPDIAGQVDILRANGFSDKEIATVYLRDVSDAILAKALGVASTTVYRWRKAVTNGHELQKESH